MVKGYLLTSEQFAARTGRLLRLEQFQIVRNFVKDLIGSQLFRTEMSKLESLLTSGAIFRKSLLKIYMLLVDCIKGGTTLWLKWEYDLQNCINKSEWDRTDRYVMEISANIVAHESFCKVRCRWYMTPRRIHRWFPDADKNCWR